MGFLGSWGDGADVRHRPLAACGLVVVRAGALGVPLNWVPQAPAVRTGNATVGSFFPRCVTRYLRVLWAQTPPPCLAPRTVWATACLGGSPGRWTHWGPLERLLGSLGSSWGQAPTPAEGSPAVPCRVYMSGTTAGVLHACSKSFPAPWSF